MRAARTVIPGIVVVAMAAGGWAQPARLEIWNVTKDAGGLPTLRWSAETNGYGNLSFTLQGTTSLALPFQDLAAPVGEAGPFVVEDTVLGSAARVFYRVKCPPAFTPLGQAGAFRAHDAGATGGMATQGYGGAVFEGRYVYFVPYQAAGGLHGRVLRYDTWGSFEAAASYAAHDASGTGGGGAAGYSGGVFDGRHVYFCPAGGHGKVLRLDTEGPFDAAGSYAVHDADPTDGLTARGFQGAAFDGRFVYFVPHNNGIGAGWNGIVLRYDTTQPFATSGGWDAWDAGATGGLATVGYSGAVFDGRYVYFAPIVDAAGRHGRVLRHDTTLPFQDAASWSARDSGTTDGLATVGFKGAVSDGRYVYFVPYTPAAPACNVLRLDTLGDFGSAASWRAFDAEPVDGVSTQGYHGATFDGRHVHFVPYQAVGSVWHGRVLTLDTAGPFADLASWHARDVGATDGLATKGYIGAAFDGRFVYMAPFRGTGGTFHGNVLRFDARLPREIPAAIHGGSSF